MSPRSVAFYLPQFHRISENDEWWGEGFTEWTNVRRAQPQFDGHEQPRVPQLGEYDLTDPKILRRQTDMASEFGIDAFCMYFYWFDGHRLLERPLESWRRDSSLLPYCLSWANESWTRRWDGKERHVLMPQGYKAGFADGLFSDLLPHFRAPHYLRQDGLPVFVVHRADLVPHPRQMADELRKLALDSGLPGLYLVAAETKPGLRPESLGFDAVVEFPPVGANTLGTALLSPLGRVSSGFRGRLMSYDRLAKRYASRPEPDFVRFSCVVPSWDNSARRQKQATIYVGATPNKYGTWLKTSRRRETTIRGAKGMVFINAWNEWAEGAYLEPDTINSFAYLHATHPDWKPSSADSADTSRALLWSYPQVRSLGSAAAGTLLALARRLRNHLRRN